MFYFYVTVSDTTEVIHTPRNSKCTLVHIEVPNKKFVLKTVNCTAPSYTVNVVVELVTDELKE